MEIDSLRSKLIEEEVSHKKLQEQFLVEKLKRAGTHNATEEEIKNDSQEIIRGTCPSARLRETHVAVSLSLVQIWSVSSTASACR